MTRRCASRNCLVCVGSNPVARDSFLRGARQAEGGRTASHADCCCGRSFEKSSLPGPRWGTAWYQRACDRRHSVYCVVSCAGPTSYHRHDLAWGAQQEELDLCPCQNHFRASFGYGSTRASRDDRFYASASYCGCLRDEQLAAGPAQNAPADGGAAEYRCHP